MNAPGAKETAASAPDVAGSRRPRFGRVPIRQALVGAAWVGPEAGSIGLVAFAAFSNDALSILLGGGLVWLVAWLVAAIGYGPSLTPQLANPRSFGELENRLAMVEARAIAIKHAAPSAYAEVMSNVDWVRSQLTDPSNLIWVDGSGYIALWQRVHRADEAVIEGEAADQLRDEVLRDQLRLTDSAIPNRDDLLAILRNVGRFLRDATKDSSIEPCIDSPEAARSAVREVRLAINEFRDLNWNGLLQLRNQTMTALLLTNAALFAFAALAVIGGARRNAILAAAIFYLIGAAVGLFNRLYQQSQAGAAVEDYGLSMARLVALPVYSGLAAMAGVLITEVAGTTSVSKVPDLSTFFVVPPNAALLVVAAAFGIAPDLVLNRLGDASEKFRSGIATTEPAILA